jgi:hypothetical protein
VQVNGSLRNNTTELYEALPEVEAVRAGAAVENAILVLN